MKRMLIVLLIIAIMLVGCRPVPQSPEPVPTEVPAEQPVVQQVVEQPVEQPVVTEPAAPATPPVPVPPVVTSPPPPVSPPVITPHPPSSMTSDQRFIYDILAHNMSLVSLKDQMGKISTFESAAAGLDIEGDLKLDSER